MAADRALSVSDALLLAKGALEGLRLRVVGEVSEAVLKPGYKAIYFSLKDGSAVMPCLMWRDVYESSGIKLEDGRLVEVTGFFTVYPAKGRLQFQVRQVVIAGEGMLRLQVAELARRLEAEGLMDPARKRALPAFPARIGVVTSPRGKAIHDILLTLKRRYPVAEVVVAGVQVEGEGAVSEIVRGIEALSTEPGIGVIIVGRGGGSYEDLMPFNAEALARAIANCPVPVVTGIGHEPDTSIADMVSDLRASTPTAAAEAVAPALTEVSARLRSERRLLGRALTNALAGSEHRLKLLAKRPVFCDPDAMLGSTAQSVDALAGALARALPARMERDEASLAQMKRLLTGVGQRLLDPGEALLARALERVSASGREVLASGERQVASAAARLDDLSPLATLGRGYAVCYSETGTVVRAASQLSRGDRVGVKLAEGRIGCVVDTVEGES